VIFQYLAFSNTFFFNAGMLGVPLLFGWLWLPADHKTVEDEEEEVVPLTKILSYKWVWLGMVASLLPCVSWGLLDTTLEFHLLPYNLDTTKIGLMFLVPALIYLVMSPPSGYISDFVGPKATAISGLLFLVLGLLVVGPAPFLTEIIPQTLWMDGVGLFLIGLGSALATVPSLEVTLDSVQDLGDVTDEVSGVLASGIAFGNTVGPFLGSTLTESLSFGWCCAIVAGINAVFILIFFASSMQELWLFNKVGGITRAKRRTQEATTLLLHEMSFEVSTDAD